MGLAPLRQARDKALGHGRLLLAGHARQDLVRQHAKGQHRISPVGIVHYAGTVAVAGHGQARAEHGGVDGQPALADERAIELDGEDLGQIARHLTLHAERGHRAGTKEGLADVGHRRWFGRAGAAAAGVEEGQARRAVLELHADVGQLPVDIAGFAPLARVGRTPQAQGMALGAALALPVPDEMQHVRAHLGAGRHDLGRRRMFEYVVLHVVAHLG